MTTNERLKRMVADCATDIDAVVYGTFDFDTCGYDTEDEYADLSTPYDRLALYFNDVLDVEYRVDAQLKYKSVCLTLACGGPGIYLDTWDEEIIGVWSGTKITARISKHVAAKIDEFFEEQYDCLRGCY